MKVAGKVTPRIRARILELFEGGGTIRGIAATLEAEMDDPPARSTIARVLEGAKRPDGAPEAPKTGPRRPQAPRSSPERPRDVPEAPQDDEEPARVRAPALPADASPSAVAIWGRMRAVGAKITALEPDVSSGAYPATQWAALIKVETQLARELADHIPPPPPDPAKDPTNIAARAMVHAQVVQLIEAGAARVGLSMRRAG